LHLGGVFDKLAEIRHARQKNLAKTMVPKNVSGGNPPPSLSGEAAAKLVQRQEKKIESHQTAEQRRQESRTAPDRIDGAVP